MKAAGSIEVPCTAVERFPAEEGCITVTEAIIGLGGIEVFAQHEPPGFEEPKLPLELKWAHRRRRPDGA